MPLPYLDEVFGMARINSAVFETVKYFLDFIPATNETIFVFLKFSLISLNALRASLGLTAIINKSTFFASFELNSFMPIFFNFLLFCVFLSMNKILFLLCPLEIIPSIRA